MVSMCVSESKCESDHLSCTQFPFQSHASSDTASFSSISLSSSLYPDNHPTNNNNNNSHHSNHHSSHQQQHQQQPQPSQSSSKHSHSKRSSSSRSHASEHGQQQHQQHATKKRKEPSSSSSSSLQLPSYPHSNNSGGGGGAATAAELYSSSAAAAAQYPTFEYYPGGFSEIMSSIDRAKIYEQWGQLCPGNLPWMAEYCKQAATLMPPSGGGGGGGSASTGFGLGGANPLSLAAASNLHHGSDYSTDLSHSVDALKPLPYLDPYTAYAMAQPYMYSAFGMPK